MLSSRTGHYYRVIRPSRESPITYPSSAGFEHLVQNSLQGVVLQGCRHALLISKLLVDLVVLAVAILLAAHDDAVVGRQGLLEAHADAEADDGS